MSGEKVSADEAERALIEARIQAERVNEANHTDPPAEKETSPFVHLLAEMKYEICSFLSDSEKFEPLKFANREKLELLKSQTFQGKKTIYISFASTCGLRYVVMTTFVQLSMLGVKIRWRPRSSMAISQGGILP